VLAPGPTAGLQVQNPDGEWINVPVIEDTFVITLGEMTAHHGDVVGAS
jgi:isopenicillin N synthase-like dioxygenase